MLHAIVQFVVCASLLVDLLAASPTTVYDSYSDNRALLVRSAVDETLSRGREPSNSISSPRSNLLSAPGQPDPDETLPVQQQLLGGVTRVPWYGLTELSDILLLGVLVTVAILGTLLFVVLVLGLRTKLHLFRGEEPAERDILPLSADYALQQVRDCSSKVKTIKTTPSPPIVLLEASALLNPVPTTCVTVTTTGDGGYRCAEQQLLNLSDKKARRSPTKANKRLPAVRVPLPEVATVNMSASIGAATIDPTTNGATDDPDTEQHLTIDDKENCVQRRVHSEQSDSDSGHPVGQRNVLKRQAVAELSVFGPVGTPPGSPASTYIQLLTPSSASSLSTSAATTDNNATPTKADLADCGGSVVGGGGGVGPLSAAFGFSPRSIQSFTVQTTATYFRFPDVDDFTPTPRTLPPKRHGNADTCSTPPAVDARTEEEEEDGSEQTKHAPVKVSVLAPSPGSMPLPPPPPMAARTSEAKIERESAEIVKEPEPRTARICAPMANRRVRLKSISLDSEGARLVEENLSSTIPVQELVGMAAHRSGGFDSVIDDDDDDDDDDDNDDYERKHCDNDKANGPAADNATGQHETEDEKRRAKRVRNILNLRLNIPPLPLGTGSGQSRIAAAGSLAPPPAASQSTGSVAKPIVKTVTVTGSISNPTMSTQQQHHHHMEDSNEQFYFEYFDYGDDDEDDETDDDEYDEVEYGEEDGEGHEDNNNNNNNSSSGHTIVLPPVPKTPTLSQSKQKASSLDSDKLKVSIPYGGSGVGGVGGGAASTFGSVSCSGGMSHIMSIAQPTSGTGMMSSMLSYMHSHPQQQTQQQYGQFQFHQQQQSLHTTHQTSGQLQQPRRVSSVSVPTTPKRYQYRTAVNHHYYHHQQQQQHYASGQSKLKPSYPYPTGPTGSTSSSSSTALVSDGATANGNRKDKKSPHGLPTPQSQSPSDKEKSLEEGTKPSVPTSGRSSILQRRGSNHSLTLNLDVYNRGGSVDLTSSSCSLYRGSYKNLHQVQSHTQLYQPHPVEPPVRVQCHQASPQQQQPTPAGTSSTAMVDGSSNTTTNTGNLNNNTSNTSKKNLLQRRGSNTSLTLNLRSGVGTGGGGGGAGSSFGLNRFSSHNSLNAGILGGGGGGGHHHHQQQQQQNQQHQQFPSSSMVRLAGSRKSLLERRNSNASLTLINVNQRTLSVSNCNLRGSICSLNSLLTTHTQNEPAPSGMMLEEDELDGNGDNDDHHHHHNHHHHHHHNHHHHHGHHGHGQHSVGHGGAHGHHRAGGEGELRRFGSSVDASFTGNDGTIAVGQSNETNEGNGNGRGTFGYGYGRLTVGTGHTSTNQQHGRHHDAGGGHHEDARGGGGVYGGSSRQRKFRSSDSLHNINVREQGVHGCEMIGGRHHQHHGHGALERQLEGETKQMSDNTYQQRSCQSSFDERHHYGSSENFKEHQNKLSIHRGLFQKDPSTVTSTSSANNLSALGTGSLYNCCGNCCSSGCCSSCCCCCCCCCCGTIDGGGCCDGNGLALKAGNLSISNSNVRNISTKPLSPQTTSEDFKIYLANIQFLQNASNVLTIAYLRKLHNFFSKTYRKMVASAASTAIAAQEAFRQRTHSRDEAAGDGKEPRERVDETVQDVTAGNSTKMMLLHSDSLHHPPVCDDESYDEEHKKMVLKIHQEFWDLPTNYQEKPLVFGSQAKNRYKTILPNEHSRVILEPERAPIAGGEPYINANYIKGPDYSNNSYIATQGPLPNTIYEFWLMVYQNVARTATAAGTSLSSTGIEQKIVMLTNFVENGRQKCAIYFPQNEDDWLAFGNTAEVDVGEVLQEKDTLTTKVSSCLAEVQKGSNGQAITISARCDSCFFLVHNVCVEQRNGYTVRTLNVIYGQKVEAPSEGTPVVDNDGCTLFELIAFRAQHYWFPDWPDHRSPNDINVLLDLSLDVLGTNVIDTPRPESNNSLKGNQPGTPGLEEIVSAGQLAALCSSATPNVLPIIHCSAGIGRTGCLIAILNGLRQLRLSVMAHQRRQQQLKQSQQVVACNDDRPVAEGHKTAADELQDELEQSLPLPPVPDGPEARRKSATSLMSLTAGNGTLRGQRGEGGTLQQRESGQVDILGIVCNLRLQRGGMVQNSEQYELIHRALCLYLEKLTQEGHIL
ncbi:uncharacterized protein LOC126561022 [Anopheles maculipalpis]|uniref:uncharacterized protein LOC126561022 n=1 Tax=Anopheles maculipalpis TaxID=1496333 RepID=UPI0021598136|nr:uncharacterized protein LOC126561022 [Anopheles maculipalpis]